MELVDLHTHTTASDGSLTPAELVAAARDAGLKAVAVTDHDTTAGLDQALAAGREMGLTVVPGVEISVEAGLAGGVHVVGLFVDHHHPSLAAALERLQQARAQRNPRMVERLNRLGIPLTLEEVTAFAGGEIVSRAHFAQALVARGVVASREEAFARYLGAGKPAYVPKQRLSPHQAIALLRRAGAVPILAHPGLLPLERGPLEELVRRFQEMGLEGLEAHYSEHDRPTRLWLERLAARLGLVVSGGSDFHGRAKPDIALGRGKGDLAVPLALLRAIEKRRDSIRSQPGGQT
jgi:hypothetical protein